MLEEKIQYKIIDKNDLLFPYVKYFWQIDNRKGIGQEVVILPDGCFDIIFHTREEKGFNAIMTGLGTEADKSAIDAGILMFGIGFKLPAAEYLFNITIAPLLDSAEVLPQNFWNICPDELNDFELISNKVREQLVSMVPQQADSKKMELFKKLYANDGELAVADVAGELHWNSRQINRYFTNWFGLSLKTYCNILRYRASFKHIRDGKLFPEKNFTDQAHFIKTVKKYSGVTPKELAKNKDDRFIQFFGLPS